jgi:hypothetical protein
LASLFHLAHQAFGFKYGFFADNHNKKESSRRRSENKGGFEGQEQPHMRFAIKLDIRSLALPSPICTLCGKPEVLQTCGPNLCMLYTGELVCNWCVAEDEIMLIAIVSLANFAENYLIELEASRREYGIVKSYGGVVKTSRNR